ncbi:MAG TPA: GAF domain-containing protein [Polyangiaceae bacterium]|nr:GAF domain-containing protein [Polyangiaceae bacterium]
MADLDDPLRLDPFGLHLTDVSRDELLDSLVRKVALRADTPIALVSLVMGRIQLFRAAVGLPAELEKSRATSRCSSFCQLVVKAEHEILITDADADERVPKDLVERYGIKAYIGVPIHHEGAVIGSLCAVDTKPRSWDPSLPHDLKAIGAELEVRLEALRESRDENDAEAIPDVALDLMLSSIHRDAKALAEPVSRMGELLKAEAWRDPKAAAATDSEPGAARELAELYRSLNESTQRFRRGALRIADALELRHSRVDRKVLASIRKDARAVYRALGELGPLARLIEGLSSGAISAEAFAKNVGALSEAEAAADDMLTSIKSLEQITDRVIKTLGPRAR